MGALPKVLRGPRGSATHQQFPRRPCRMSDGRGVRKTDHLTPRSLKLLQLISWGRSHFLMRCWTLSASGKPTERGPGGKLSSTKFTEFWRKAGAWKKGWWWELDTNILIFARGAEWRISNLSCDRGRNQQPYHQSSAETHFQIIHHLF